MLFLQETESSTNQTRPLPTLTRALNAISQYPITRHLIAHLPRKDVYNLALSHSAIYYTLNLQSRASHESVLARCIRTCDGPPCWGVPEDMYFIEPKQHKALEEDPGEDMDVQIQSIAANTRQCGTRLAAAGYAPLALLFPQFPHECAIELANQDDVYYDFNNFMKHDRIPSPDPTCSKKSECADYCYSCWECGVKGSPPYGGFFMCGWCLGRVGFVAAFCGYREPRNVTQYITEYHSVNQRTVPKSALEP
ncbi:hypothetical protein B9Z19DRAFT_1061449 [Tuber borchii]|uniref:Uncharacterized protein n=1 Tax=Tuber borchii TaxID=42251 RepID=A0A2T7A593_TUBBO|nr:hypothetical protein B9Z19DRAFT_1061449 [Tuber borchii]